jgi:hypothetical protein
MLQALKHDIIALEYPINYFISQSIHNGEVPYWFNTWGMGFPLQSNLSWGLFSTPQLLFCSLFDYNIWILHIEFMFFILLSGWSMFYLLQKFVVKDETIAQVLAACYMLSGFMVGSSQWLLYITAAAFVPLVLSALLQLLKRPSFFHALQFSVMYTLMFTSVYAAFNIITTYGLVIFVLIYLLRNKEAKQERSKLYRYLLLSGGFTLILCIPVLYFTAELLQQISRGEGVVAGSAFAQSNYLHPSALSSLLLPFSSVRMNFWNTEGTMLNTYIGLFSILLLPVAIRMSLQQKHKTTWFVLSAAVLFLLLSFGHLTPARDLLNFLPGFSYFRNPAIFRFYFIFSILIYIAVVFREFSWSQLLELRRGVYGRILKYSFAFLFLICLVVFLFHIKSLKELSLSPISGLIKNMSLAQTLSLNAGLQLIMLSLLLLAVRKKKLVFAKYILGAELILNTFICTPFFTVSSYSLPAVATIFHSEKGFPVQTEKPADVPTNYTDGKLNTWPNVNVYQKKVSSMDSYYGPLVLKSDGSENVELKGRPLVFAEKDSLVRSLQLLLQRPTHIKISVDLLEATSISVRQNYYTGWKVLYNGKLASLLHTMPKTLTVEAPAGKGTIDFIYERKSVWISALMIHLLIIGFLLYIVYRRIRRR